MNTTQKFYGAALSALSFALIFSGCETPTTSTPTPATIERWDFPNRSAPNFGYGLMRSADFAAHYNEARFWPDRRPVLLAALKFSDMPMHRSIAEIENVIFGTGAAGAETSQSYFNHVSLGNTQIVRGITLETVDAQVPRNANTEVIERGLVIQKALDSGIDLTALYDTNRDGTISEAELLVVTMVADAPGTGGGGAVRGYCQSHTSSDRKRTARFCGRSASFSEYAGFYVVTHELTHLFGAIDLYNIGELGINGLASLMAGAGPQDKIYLDPYHRVKLGWIGPRSFNVASGTNSCFRISPSHKGVEALGEIKPIVVYDSRRGMQDYFMVEYRRRAGYDQNVIDEGIAVWSVHENTSQFAIPQVIGYTRGGGSRNLASLSTGGASQGDDQIINAWADNMPLVLTTGINMNFDTPRMAPDVDMVSNGVLNYPPAHFAPGQTSGAPRDRRLGYPKFWKPADFQTSALNWYAPYSRTQTPVGVSIRMGEMPSSAAESIRVDFISNSNAPLATECQ